MTTHLPLTPRVPDGLSRRAQHFIRVHGLRVPCLDVESHRDQWLGHGIPAEEINRARDFQERWGGTVLPPAPVYEGGPRYLEVDTPEDSDEEGWWIPAGDGRVSMAYAFMLGPAGEFGIHGNHWTPLHAGVEGWVESLALASHATLWAKSITKITGDAVETLDLTGYERVPEIQGITDNWWRGADSLIAIYRGEAECLAAPQCRTAHIYAGLDDWGLNGG